MALLVYDYLCTLELEVQHIWPSRWSLTKVLYVVTRYSPFIDVPMSLYFYFSPDITIAECRKINRVIVWLTGIGVGSAQGILVVRTISLYDNNRRLMQYVCCFLILIYTPTIVLLLLWSTSVPFGVPPPGIVGCHFSGKHPIMLGSYAAIALSETLLVGLSVWIGIKKFRRSAGHLITTFYRDGVFFFMYLFIMSITNIVASVFSPNIDLPSTCQRVMHAIFSARLILHLREAACESSESMQYLPRISSIHFNHTTSQNHLARVGTI
ncbi:hypothetical protein B0H34DRAFT_720349 [Crassisporium funariophilum]|nr:hypothetical protein B0H34DRAFT_720349 [Crassisporium funariophilum]